MESRPRRRSVRPVPAGVTRRAFVGGIAAGAAALGAFPLGAFGAAVEDPMAVLPTGDGRAPVTTPHFPSRWHAFVWRNWPLVPAGRLASVSGATTAEVRRAARAMGLRPQPRPDPVLLRRGYITVIRRNWHLLPYPQLLALLGWDAPRLAFTLREDDFLWIKLGGRKPRCAELRWRPPTAAEKAAEAAFGRAVRSAFDDPANASGDLPFSFVRRLSRAPGPADAASPAADGRPLRFCYSYFAPYGDPLLEPELDPYPDGLLARLAASGVTGVWLQGVLSRLAPFPWDPALSARHEERLRNLRALARRAARHGIRVFLYLNEPRAMPEAFFRAHPGLRGVAGGDHATLCTSHPDVRRWLVDSVAAICRAAPELGGFFTITASENLTNCWSHGGGRACPRCGPRGPAAVVADVNAAVVDGIASAAGRQRLLAWDWGWGDDWAPAAIAALPPAASLQSVSEWSLPVERGGVRSEVGEYSLSAVGPGPRATRHWSLARGRGLRTVAKVQAGCTWELAALPYLPVLENVAEHASRLRAAGIDDVMLGWTLGGYPSPNLAVFGAVMAGGTLEDEARRRFGAVAPDVVAAWKACSAAFREFPYHIGVVYNAPLQMGPANPLWESSTGHPAAMVGLPHDDLAAWRGPFPPEVFAGQLRRVASGFASAAEALGTALASAGRLPRAMRGAAQEQATLALAASLHFRSVANQTDFVRWRDAALASAAGSEARGAACDALERLLRDESDAARALHRLQCGDARIGFEASNHYFYLPVDLAEKVVNCADLLGRWLPGMRAKNSFDRPAGVGR